MVRLLKLLAITASMQLVSSCWKDKEPLFNGISCKKNCLIATGTIKDSVANAGIEGVKIEFYYESMGFLDAATHYLGKTRTDAAGNYTFRFNASRFADRPGYYSAKAYKGDLFTNFYDPNWLEDFNLDSARYDQPFVQNFFMHKPATVQVHVVADTLLRNLHLRYWLFNDIAGKWFITSRQVDTTLTFTTAGGLKTGFFVTGYNTNTNFYTKADSITVPPYETRTVELRLR